MKEFYDYCDAYDAYGCKYNAVTSLDENKSNTIKTFSCNVCKQSKLVLKKSVSDPIFKCDKCIQRCENEDEDEETKLHKSWWRWIFQKL
jgi:transcription elongation factor Elf1